MPLGNRFYAFNKHEAASLKKIKDILQQQHKQ
jgi:hypothetical protein